MKKELKQRKHPRLKNYDYSQPGTYFLTINTERNYHVLSDVIETADGISTRLSLIGEITRQELFGIEKRYPYMHVDEYVIMPTHLHVIIALDAYEEDKQNVVRPSVLDAVCVLKSLATRIANEKENRIGRKIFQDSLFDKVIRTKEQYFAAKQYIRDNPKNWEIDRYNPINWKDKA